MTNNKIGVVGMVAILIIAIGGYFFPNVMPVLPAVLGGDANTRFPHGLDVTESGCYAVDGTCIIDENGAVSATTLTLSGTLTANSYALLSYGLATSTLGTSQTLVQADLLYNSFLMTPNVGSLTLTLPATSTLTSLVPSAGDRSKWCISNATTTAGVTVTLATATGFDLLSSTSTLALDPAEVMCVEFMRKSNTDISAMVDIYTDAE